MSAGLWAVVGTVVGAVLCFFLNRKADQYKEQNRQKVIISVIDAKLSAYKEKLQQALSKNTYDEVVKKSKEIFENLSDETRESQQDETRESQQNDLRDSDIGIKIRGILGSSNNHALIRDTLKFVLDEDFLATDHDSAFLGKEFLINKFKLRKCIRTLYSYYTPDHKSNHPNIEILWGFFEGVYLLEDLSDRIKKEISSNRWLLQAIHPSKSVVCSTIVSKKFM